MGLGTIGLSARERQERMDSTLLSQEKWEKLRVSPLYRAYLSFLDMSETIDGGIKEINFFQDSLEYLGIEGHLPSALKVKNPSTKHKITVPAAFLTPDDLTVRIDSGFWLSISNQEGQRVKVPMEGHTLAGEPGYLGHFQFFVERYGDFETDKDYERLENWFDQAKDAWGNIFVRFYADAEALLAQAKEQEPTEEDIER
jgi:hypothetical protein